MGERDDTLQSNEPPGSSSESSASSSASSASSAQSRSTSPDRGGAHYSTNEQQVEAVVTKHRLAREHQLRRLLSQRRLGDPEAVEGSFMLRRECLRDEDAVLLLSLSNALCYSQLVAALQEKAPSAKEPIDRLLSRVNPLFHQQFTCPLRAPAQLAVSAQERLEEEDSEMKALAAGRPPMQRKQLTRSADVVGAHGNAAEGEPLSKKLRKDQAGPSAAGGLVAQSMAQWESFLGDELKKEGETIENFRQSRSKHSYLDKSRFQQEAQWNEYLRERQLQDRQKELEMKRAIRRGETET